MLHIYNPNERFVMRCSRQKDVFLPFIIGQERPSHCWRSRTSSPARGGNRLLGTCNQMFVPILMPNANMIVIAKSIQE